MRVEYKVSQCHKVTDSQCHSDSDNVTFECHSIYISVSRSHSVTVFTFLCLRVTVSQYLHFCVSESQCHSVTFQSHRVTDSQCHSVMSGVMNSTCILGCSPTCPECPRWCRDLGLRSWEPSYHRLPGLGPALARPGTARQHQNIFKTWNERNVKYFPPSHLVAHPASAVLVHAELCPVLRPLQGHSGVHHGSGQGHSLLAGELSVQTRERERETDLQFQTLHISSHQPGAQLNIRNLENISPLIPVWKIFWCRKYILTYLACHQLLYKVLYLRFTKIDIQNMQRWLVGMMMMMIITSQSLNIFPEGVTISLSRWKDMIFYYFLNLLSSEMRTHR